MPINLHIHMDTLFTLHDKLLDMSEMINDLYALQIVAFITVAFVIILFGFFFETKVIVMFDNQHKLNSSLFPKVIFWLWGQNTRLILIATSYLLWGVLLAMVIYKTLSVCTQTREEAYEAALIVHKILQNKPVFMLNDEIFYNKMKSFTLQILHRKKTFNFNGLGLFQLDYTFIFSVRISELCHYTFLNNNIILL